MVIFLVENLEATGTIGATGKSGGACWGKGLEEVTMSSIIGEYCEGGSVTGLEDWWEKYSQSRDVEEGEWW